MAARRTRSIEGDSGFLGAPGGALALAYGAWAPHLEAKKLELATDALKERGEAFVLTLRSKAGAFVDVEGRPVTGRAVVRFREVTGERAQVLKLQAELERLGHDHAALTGLLSGLPQPAWLRRPDGRLSWCNAAYARAVEAASGEDAVLKGLELLDRGEREGAARARSEGQAFSRRAPAVVAGQRRTLDILELPTPSGFAGMATDMSELEAVRSDLQRQMDAHVATLDRLKTAVAVFDASQRLLYRNSGYRCAVVARPRLPRWPSQRQRNPGPAEGRTPPAGARRLSQLEGRRAVGLHRHPRQ